MSCTEGITCFQEQRIKSKHDKKHNDYALLSAVASVCISATLEIWSCIEVLAGIPFIHKGVPFFFDAVWH